MTRKDIMPDNVGHIYIYGSIGYSSQTDYVTSSDFINEFKYLESMYSTIYVHINSGGGSVVEGYAIFTAILDSKSDIMIYIDGLAASMAGIIAMAGDCIYMRDYSLLMIHNPNGGDSKSLEAIKETLVTMISKRVNKDPNEISEIMNEETWLNAEEALKQGFIDEIIETEEKEYIEEELNDLYAVSNSIDSVDLYNIFNKKINNNMNNKAEESFFKKLFTIVNNTEVKNKAEKADDSEDNSDVIADLKRMIEDEKKEKQDLLNRLDELEAERKASKEKDVVDFLTNCVATNVIKEEEFDKFKNLASVDFETTKELLEKSKVNIGKPTNITNQLVKNEINKIGEGRDNWTLLDWAKNDPKGLEELKTSNSVIYEELLNKSNSTYIDRVKS